VNEVPNIQPPARVLSEMSNAQGKKRHGGRGSLGTVGVGHDRGDRSRDAGEW